MIEDVTVKQIIDFASTAAPDNEIIKQIIGMQIEGRIVLLKDPELIA